MRAIIYSYNEAPVVLEEVLDIEVNHEGDDLTITSNEGRTQVDMKDAKKVELEND